MPPTIRLKTVADVLDAVPVLLGFYPTESLCALFFNQEGDHTSIAVTSRMDLPTDPEAMAHTVGVVLGLLDRHPRVALVAYTADQEEARTIMRHILRHLDADDVLAAILATAPGWTTVDPEQPDAIGWTNSYRTTTSTVAAEFAAAGLHASGTRDDLHDSIQAPDPGTAADYAAARRTEGVPTQPTSHEKQLMASEIRDWITGYVAQPTIVTVEEAAYLAARIQHDVPRDELMRILDKSTAPALAALWQAVAGLTPDTDALAVLASLGLAAWVARNGALANVALDRARQLPEGPGSHLIEIVGQLTARAVPPNIWDDLKRDL